MGIFVDPTSTIHYFLKLVGKWPLLAISPLTTLKPEDVTGHGGSGPDIAPRPTASIPWSGLRPLNCSILLRSFISHGLRLYQEPCHVPLADLGEEDDDQNQSKCCRQWVDSVTT